MSGNMTPTRNRDWLFGRFSSHQDGQCQVRAVSKESLAESASLCPMHQLQHEEETVRGTRLKREPILFWVTLDCRIVNHYGIQV